MRQEGNGCKKRGKTSGDGEQQIGIRKLIDIN